MKKENRVSILLKNGWKKALWKDEDGIVHEVITIDGPLQGYKESEIYDLSESDFEDMLKW